MKNDLPFVACRAAAKLLLCVAVLAAAPAAWAAADLVLNHSDSPDPGPAGGIFTYTLRIDNNGPDLATAVALNDTLPPGSQFVSASASAGSCTAPALGADGTVQCSLGNLPFTSPVTSFVTVTIQVRLPAAGVWTNLATATSTSPDQNSANNTAIANQTTAVASADLSVSATAMPPNVVAGAPFSFAVTTSNNGPDALPADAVQFISFAVPAGAAVTAQPSGSGWSCTAGGYPRTSGNIVCLRNGPLAAGAAAPQLTVPASANTLGNVTVAFATGANQADSSPMPDSNTANNTSNATVTASAGSDVAVSKAAASSAVPVGGNVSYTVTPTHVGGQPPGTGGGLITVTDTLGANLSFVSAGGAGWTCGVAGQVITCSRPGPFTGGNYSAMPVITVVATANAAGILGNQVSISAPEPDPVPANNTGFANVTAGGTTDLRMEKRASMSVLVPNQPFVYVLSATNAGPLPVAAGQTIRIVDTLPGNLQLIAAPRPAAGSAWVCSTAPAGPFPIAGAVVTCDLPGPLGVNNNTPVVNLDVRMPAAGGATNNACVSLSGPGPADGAAGNDCRGVTVTTSATQADLQVISLTALPATVASGQLLTYVATIVNNGPDSATNVTVANTVINLLAANGLQSATPSQGSCAPPGPSPGPSQIISCNLGTLASGASATVTIVIRPVIAVSGTRANFTSVSSPDVGDPDLNSNGRTVVSNVTAVADLTVAKSATPASLPAGAPLTYVVTVGNSGPSTAQTVSMTDTLPANAAFLNLVSVSGSGSCSTVPAAGATGGTLVCGWPSIEAGTQQTVSYRVRPLNSAAGGAVTNAVAVTTPTAESSLANNSATTTTPVTPAQLDILVNKIDSTDPVDVGGLTTYTISINNAGPSTGTNVVLTDVFPAPGPVATAQFSYQGGLTVNQAGVCAQPAVGAMAGTLSCSFPALDAGQTATVTYQMRAETLTVPGSTSGTAFNRASVTVTESETTLANNTVVEGTTSRRNAVATDLGISKVVNRAVAQPGDALTYTLTVTNNGPSASDGAQVIDTLPAGTTFGSAPGCAATGNTVTCPIGPLAVGAARAFTVNANVDLPYGGGPNVVNTASVDAPGDTNPGNNTATASTQVTAAPVGGGGGGVEPVPTLSTWALMLLAAAMGWLGLRSRRRA